MYFWTLVAPILNKDTFILVEKMFFIIKSKQSQSPLYAVVITYIVFQKEEKQLDASLDDLIHRVRELKQSIQSFIYKLENDYQNISW